MKVLLLTFGRNVFTYPALVVTGGIEMVELNQISALKRSGINLTLGVTSDASVKGEHCVHLPIESFQKCGQYRLTKLIDHINETKLHEEYDVILTNRAWGLNISHKRMELMKEWAHKVRLINHEPPTYLKGFGITNLLATSKWLVGNGAKVATVMPDGQSLYNEIEESLRSGKSFSKLKDQHNDLFDSVPFDHFTSFYEVMVVPDDAIPLEDIKDDQTICFAGRPSPHKGLKHAVKAVQKGGFERKFVGHTVPPSGDSETSLWNSLSEFHGLFKVGSSHSRLMTEVANSRVFLQPSTSESAGGIVAFEAAVHGVPVVTSTNAPQRYLSPFGLFHFISDRLPDTIVNEIEKSYEYSLEEKLSRAEKVREVFSKERYANALVDFLSDT